jgi:hypothetical protein
MNTHSPDFAWNLLPWRLQQRREQHERFMRLLCKTLLASIGLLIFVHIILFALLYKQEKCNKVLFITVHKLQPKVQRIEQLKQQTILLQSQVIFLQHVIVLHQHPKVKMRA